MLITVVCSTFSALGTAIFQFFPATVLIGLLDEGADSIVAIRDTELIGIKPCARLNALTNRVPVEKSGEGRKCAQGGNPLVSGLVADLAVEVHNKASSKDDRPNLVDYWMPSWGPCRKMAPDFERSATELKSTVRSATIHTQRYPDGSKQIWIRGIPLRVLYSKGTEICSLSGTRPAKEIENFTL
jgi:thioredoxin 2